MKVNLTIELDAHARYVIAKYFGVGTRATRKQCRSFVLGATRTGVREHGNALYGRQRSNARRLAEGRPLPGHGGELTPPREKQLSLLNGAQ